MTELPCSAFSDPPWSVRLLANNLTEVCRVRGSVAFIHLYSIHDRHIFLTKKTTGTVPSTFPVRYFDVAHKFDKSMHCKYKCIEKIKKKQQYTWSRDFTCHYPRKKTYTQRHFSLKRKRISGAGFLRLSGMGTGSLGLLLSFLVIAGFTSIESEISDWMRFQLRLCQLPKWLGYIKMSLCSLQPLPLMNHTLMIAMITFIVGGFNWVTSNRTWNAMRSRSNFTPSTVNSANNELKTILRRWSFRSFKGQNGKKRTFAQSGT